MCVKNSFGYFGLEKPFFQFTPYGKQITCQLGYRVREKVGKVKYLGQDVNCGT